jgi:hypothetical protein
MSILTIVLMSFIYNIVVGMTAGRLFSPLLPASSGTPIK